MTRIRYKPRHNKRRTLAPLDARSLLKPMATPGGPAEGADDRRSSLNTGIQGPSQRIRDCLGSPTSPPHSAVGFSDGALRILGLWAAVYLTLGERIIVPLGPSRAVPIANLLSVVIVAALIIPRRHLREEAWNGLLGAPLVLAFAAIWSAYWLAAPILGFPVTTFYSLTIPAVIIASIAVGLILSRQGFPVRQFFTVLLVVAWTQVVAGTMQALFYTQTVITAPQTLLYLWDRAICVQYGIDMIAGRSVGLYINPNTYTLLGAFLLILALTLPGIDRARRLALAVPAAGIVALGASRSAILVLALLAAYSVVRKWRSLGFRRASTQFIALAAAVVGMHFLLTQTASPLYSRFVQRWSTIPALLAQGASGDRNVANRFSAWALAFDHWVNHPFGSYGPSQYAVGSFTDNDYFSLLLQGGVLLLFSYLGALATIYSRRRYSALSPCIAPMVGLLAVTGMTQNSAVYGPSIAMFWLVGGSALSSRSRREHDAKSPNVKRRALLEGARRRRRAWRVAIVCVAILGVALAMRAAGIVYADNGRPIRPSRTAKSSTELPAVRAPGRGRLRGYAVDLPYLGEPEEDRWASTVLSESDKRRLAAPPAPITITATGDRTEYSAVSMSISGLRDYTRFVYTGDERFATRARFYADWLVANQASDGSWRNKVATYDLRPGWASASTQGYAISLLARLYQDTGDTRYLRSAEAAYRFMLAPAAGGRGTLSSFDNGDPVLEGYPGSKLLSHSLSGALAGIWGVNDLAIVTRDEDVSKQFVRLSESLATNLDEYDVVGWSRFSLGEMNGPASDIYHRLFISQLRALAQHTGDERFEKRSRRWEQNLEEWIRAYDPDLERAARQSAPPANEISP